MREGQGYLCWRHDMMMTMMIVGKDSLSVYVCVGDYN